MARILVLTKLTPAPNSKLRKRLVGYLTEAGFKEKELAFVGVAPDDAPWDVNLTRADLKAFPLERHMKELHTTHVLAFGNEALTAATGHSGIMKWKSKMMGNVFATVAVSMIDRNPSQELPFKADLKLFYNQVRGIAVTGNEPAEIVTVDTREKLKALLAHLKTEATMLSFDLETSGFDELASDAFIVSIAVTTSTLPHSASRSDLEASMQCFAVPLHHRASVWRTSWRKVLEMLAQAMRAVPERVAHNAKFDCRWMAQFSSGVPATFDTMLAAHLLDENRPKGLKPLARILLGASEWDIQIAGGKNAAPWYEQHKLSEILRYNALDTWHTARLWRVLNGQLEEQPRLATINRRLMVPASQSFVHIERHGVWLDREALHTNARVVDEKLDSIHSQLMQWVPDETPYPVNFNPSSFLRWWLYEHLGLPVLQRGKTGPSTAEGVLSRLAGHHPAVPILLDRVSWNKAKSAFFNPYLEQITENDRLHTTFKLTGTVTGRLSSGKADLDKVTGARSTRGVNLQQVPRDPLVRGLFGAPEGWTFVEADYSQIELRIAAELAQEQTMLHLYATGQDIHMAMAMQMTGKPASRVTSEERKKAKAVNFGFLYGMGWRKFVSTAWENYGVEVTEAEAQQFRTAFFTQFSDLRAWHSRQRRLAHRYKRVESPIGRVRHLPDIDSPDEGVRAEAERQSINSPVQAMASDLTLISLVLLDRKFRKMGLRATPLGTVHDAINFEIPNDELEIALPVIKRTMERPPLEKLFGVSLTVPIVADVAVGKRWGHKEEIPADIIHTERLGEWLKSRKVM